MTTIRCPACRDAFIEVPTTGESDPHACRGEYPGLKGTLITIETTIIARIVKP